MGFAASPRRWDSRAFRLASATALRDQSPCHERRCSGPYPACADPNRAVAPGSSVREFSSSTALSSMRSRVSAPGGPGGARRSRCTTSAGSGDADPRGAAEVDDGSRQALPLPWLWRGDSGAAGGSAPARTLLGDRDGARPWSRRARWSAHQRRPEAPGRRQGTRLARIAALASRRGCAASS